jgi:hypothetical protein
MKRSRPQELVIFTPKRIRNDLRRPGVVDYDSVS